MRRFLPVIIFALTLLAAISCDKDPYARAKERVLNVDVILPSDIRGQFQNAIDWAQENIEQAQRRSNKRVRLNLRWHDENTEDLDVLGYKLSHPEAPGDTCHAILGPYHSDNAIIVLRYARSSRIPVVMPTCTSADLQRTNARNTYAWFLTESDITQCEIMVSAAYAAHASRIALIYSDDTYGASFKDWVAYYATELELPMTEPGIQVYSRGTDLTSFIQSATDKCEPGEEVFFLVALSDASDYDTVCRQIADTPCRNGVEKSSLCADTSLSAQIVNSKEYIPLDLGICPYASAGYGFPQSYKSRFGHLPFNGEAQIYDALCLLALGAAHQWTHGLDCIVDGRQVYYNETPKDPGLTDHMRAVVSSDEGVPTKWDDISLTAAFSELYAGRSINMTGATGDLTFDRDTRTKILNTTYMAWTLEKYYEDEQMAVSRVQPIIYMSTSGSATDASVNNFWLLDKKHQQTFSDDPVEVNLPPLWDHWAVVVSPSTTWSNYRHQADAFAMYQSLKNHGYDDDHIVLIVEDNLANDTRNAFPGQIFVERGEDTGDILVNDDVRKGAVVDYHFSDLSPSDFMDIMTGRKSERLPQVISPREDSNVFFFWSGHGGSREGPLWGNEDSYVYFGMDRIRSIVDAMAQAKMYRRMMFSIETCYSGKWGLALEGTPNVLVLTAANPKESSKADVHDRDLGIYLSNAFARTFRREVNKDNDITIYNLFKELAKTTTGSHVTIYNNEKYGSVYTETMKEFFPK